jgi:hypothetical protein
MPHVDTSSKVNSAPYPMILVYSDNTHTCDVCMYYTLNIIIGKQIKELMGDEDECTKCSLKNRKYV